MMTQQGPGAAGEAATNTAPEPVLSALVDLEREILEAMVRRQDTPSLLARLCRLIERIVPESLASMMQLDPASGELRLRAAPSFPAEALPYFDRLHPGPARGSCANAVLSGQLVVVAEVADDPRWADLREVARRFGIGACWSAPIFDENHRIAGSFAMTSPTPRTPTEPQLKALETACWLGSLALRNERDEHRLRLWTTALTHASEGVIIADADGGIIDFNPASCHISGFSADQLRGLDLERLKLASQTPELRADILRAVETVGLWRGELWSRRRNGDRYPEWLSISRVPGEGGGRHVLVFSDISALKASEQKLLELAHHDPLTRLPNRLQLARHMAAAIERTEADGGELAVLFVDLDRFKNINDSLGHAAGDTLLVEAASRLLDQGGNGNMVARLGGDEFVVMIEHDDGAAAAERTAAALLDAFKKPFLLEGQEIVVTASIGISRFPQDGRDHERLLRHADIALYRAKRDGRNRYDFYRSGMGQRVRERVSLEGHLRRALERDELLLYYQPQVSSFSGLIVGAEALLRWQQPQLGLLHPSQFLPILEETRLIVAFGEWVLATALAHSADWAARGFGTPRIGVNLSRLQLVPGRFQRMLQRLLADSGVDPACLELEITEHGIIEKGDDAVLCLRELRGLGVGLAIDDFGAGYSSLARLRQLHVDRIKIDRSLVHDVGLDQDAESICAAVVALGHALGLEVTAEGVETETQAALLRLIHCDELQGFLYGRPLPAAAFAELIAEQEKV